MMLDEEAWAKEEQNRAEKQNRSVHIFHGPRLRSTQPFPFRRHTDSA